MTTTKQLVRTTFVLALATLWPATAAHAAGISSFSLTATADISGLAGSTIGWGYSITNGSDTSWMAPTALNAGSFLNLDLSVAPNPNLLFDFPIIAPGATANANYVPGLSGLYEMTWDPLAPVGFVNSGDFVLSAELEYGPEFAGCHRSGVRAGSA
jgi:hypothetical protein